MQERNSEYFDAAGNQRKEIPSDDDFVPGRDDEPGVDKLEEPDPESDASKVKVVQDYIKTKHHYNDLVTAANNASRYGGRGGRGDAIWTQKLRACDAFEPTLKKAQDALEKVLKPVIMQHFPQFEYSEDTAITNYVNAAHGHVFLIAKHYVHGEWNKIQAVVIRDDMKILPEFDRIFSTNEEMNKAYGDYRRSAPAKETLEEELRDGSAAGADVNKLCASDKIKQEAIDYATQSSWLNAFVLAYHIMDAGKEMYQQKYMYLPKDNNSSRDALKDCMARCFSIAEDINSMMHHAAASKQLPY